jgi:hypothetical protein
LELNNWVFNGKNIDNIKGGLPLKGSDYPGELAFFGAIAGTLAALIKLLVHHIFMWTGLASEFYTDLNAMLIHGHHKPEGLVDMFFVEFGDMAIGALFGIFLAFWLKASRPKYHWGIGLGSGFGIWFLSLAFGNLSKIIKPEMTTPWSLFAHLLAMLTFGILIVLAARFWKPLRSRIELGDNHGSWRR